VFIGHFALGFAAKRVTPRVSLAVLAAATQVADLLWPIFLALGFEHVRIDPGNTAVTPLDFVSYPYSHSLLLLVVWGVVFAAVTVRQKPDTTCEKTFIVIFALVVSHWLLDWITHRPDMPLYPGGAKYGLGLWNSFGWTVTLEIAMYAIGVWIYARATRPRNAKGRWGFWALAVFLPLVYLGNILGPPPPSVGAIWPAGIAGGAILVVWMWWVDRHREGIH
jgi:membrane-bound metal-dependent hydrolase YbcI (DUF457 family)